LSLRADQPLDPILWAIDTQIGDIILEGGGYNVATVLEDYCLPSTDECYRFRITGGGCNRSVAVPAFYEFNLTLNETVVDSGEIAWGCEGSITVGNCSDPVVPINNPPPCDEGFERLEVTTFHVFTPQVDYVWNITTCNSTDRTTTLLEGETYKPTDFRKLMASATCIAKGQNYLLFSYVDGGSVIYTIEKGKNSTVVSKQRPGPETVPIP
jgi:hypothetical protein